MTEKEAIAHLKLCKSSRIFIPNNDVLEIAINALEKQMPKKPTNKTKVMDERVFVGYVGKCPNCGYIVDEESVCCSECHQALDWSWSE